MKSYHMDLFDATRARSVYPNFVYQRINLIAGNNWFLFPIDSGYWFWMRGIRAKWPEIDTAGLVFAPEIFIQINESSRNRVHQNAPVPIRLIATPASNNVQINATGELTATGVTSAKMLNEIRPARDNITFIITGQNATPFPAWIDIVVIGYMIPDADFAYWRGSNDGN